MTAYCRPRRSRALRDELRMRLGTTSGASISSQRERLLKRLERIGHLYEWGDISAEEYRRKRLDTETEIAGLPSDDRLDHFDQRGGIVAGIPAAMRKATPEQQQPILRLVLDVAIVADGRIHRIAWTPPARPDRSYTPI